MTCWEKPIWMDTIQWYRHVFYSIADVNVGWVKLNALMRGLNSSRL